MYNMVLFYQPDTRYNIESPYANCFLRTDDNIRLGPLNLFQF